MYIIACQRYLNIFFVNVSLLCLASSNIHQNVGFWFGMKLYINRLSDGELSFEIRQPLYGLPLDHTIRDFGRALAQEQGWEIDGREAVKIEEAIKILYPFVPSLSHAEPEHTVFKHSALIRLLSMKYQYQR